ncbi:MAG: hypothetical protein KAR20_16480 [Candidatus Heimdallarchaeota archaeon]|nr:hypothetical protein [Candidatus Heimdallarchaeota archaeon]
MRSVVRPRIGFNLNVPWHGKRCILCLNENDFCKEHVIPESLGGKLTCYFLCRSCNSTLGHNLEAKAKSDPSVLLAVKQLESKIPYLSKSILDCHPHIGHSESGVTEGYIKSHKFRVKSKKLNDNSLIQPTDDARKSIKKILNRSGVVGAVAQMAIEKFDSAPENIKIEIAPGLEIVKWAIQKLEMDLSKADLMNPLIPVKTAFEFLALHLGESIYSDSSQLQKIRDCLLRQEISSETVKVERLSTGKHNPIHGIVFEGNSPYTKVQVRLFGWIAFRVHFFKIAVNGPRLTYTHELDTNNEVVSIT